LDWVSITAASTLKMQNSSVVNNYSACADSFRPYGLDMANLKRFYQHDAAPGPLNPGVTIETPRLRPFWAKTASGWIDNGDLSTTYPHATAFSDTGSVLIIPQVNRWDFIDIVGERANTSVQTYITQSGCEAMLTAVWTASEMATRFQASITNVWYAPIRPKSLTNDGIDLLEDFVQSVYYLLEMDVSGKERGQWMNMNEIGSWFADSRSFNN